MAPVAGERAKQVSLAVAAAAPGAPAMALAELRPEPPKPDAAARDHAGHDHGADDEAAAKEAAKEAEAAAASKAKEAAKELAKDPPKKIRRAKKAPPPPDPRIEPLLRELENHRGKFRHCRDLIPPGQGYTFAFDLTLKPVSGYVSAVAPADGDASKMASCMSAVLAKLHFHGVPEGGTIRGLRFAL
ncbi:MAG: hypothetical protein H6711_26805 [Myxococcales bacterium]|nr:hypothetical protein [Myxococcales bacterium]